MSPTGPRKTKYFWLEASRLHDPFGHRYCSQKIKTGKQETLVDTDLYEVGRVFVVTDRHAFLILYTAIVISVKVSFLLDARSSSRRIVTVGRVVVTRFSREKTVFLEGLLDNPGNVVMDPRTEQINKK